MVKSVRINRAAFTRAWLSGKHGDTIAAEFGVDRSTVTKIAKRFGLALRTRTRPARWVIAPEQIAEFRDMWRAGVKSAEIAAHFGAHRKTVENMVKKLGEARRGKGHPSQTITITQFHETRLSARMAEAARIEQAALVNAEMVDGKSSKREA